MKREEQLIEQDGPAAKRKVIFCLGKSETITMFCIVKIENVTYQRTYGCFGSHHG